MTAAPSNTLEYPAPSAKEWRDTPRPSAEEWRDIPGLPDYQASSHGRIRSFRRYRSGVILKTSPANVRSGSALTFTPPGGGSSRRGGMAVARAVALAFIGPAPSKSAKVRHHSDDALDNTPDNLYWEG